MSMKNPLTPAGIEPATFQFVAQHLNLCATAVRYNRSVVFSLCGEEFYPVLAFSRMRDGGGDWVHLFLPDSTFVTQ